MTYQIHYDSFAFTIGYFEFRLCEHNSMVTRANQSCFDNGLLLTVHGSGKTRYEINGNQQPEYHFKLDKPRASRARSVFSSGSTTPVCIYKSVHMSLCIYPSTQ